ncbi:DUF6198 family protein [Anaerovorax odorimutans]|uniref:DUF6198 family protein n=1 Tax=Anaerovorax odorimutans TaxID=109327 RepID=A0ABT1RMA7_9FIRM|nr:DUF6198 family protein [Anaerovorax odorimutans]MCQ4636071.1 DUF6198 family protein [Anaerovorax odorimutans]
MLKQNFCNTVLRYFLFLLGIFTISLGIAFSTCSSLGTTPLASLPYSLSRGFGLTMGNFMMMLNLACFIGQVILLRKQFPKLWILQIPAAFIFGWMTDFSNTLLSWLHPETYVAQLGCLAMGILLVALGLSIEVSANTIMLSVDGFVKAIVMAAHKNFGKTKVALDITLVSLSIIVSLTMLHSIEGVREGTVLAALLVGTLSRIFAPLIGKCVPKPREKVSVGLSPSHAVSASESEVV